MLQTLKEALSKTIVRVGLLAVVIVAGVWAARSAQRHYEKALKDDAKAEAFQLAADSIKKINDSLTVITKLDQARADSMLTIIRPRVIEHGQKTINSVQVAIAAAKDTGVVSVITDKKTGLPDSLITIPLPIFDAVVKAVDSLTTAYAELKFVDDSTIYDLKAVIADQKAIIKNDTLIIAKKDSVIDLKNKAIKELKKARTAGKFKQAAIVAGAAVLYLFLHR